MSLYMIGDIHSGLDSDKLLIHNFPNYNECTKEDIIIQLGDFGYIWNGSDEEIYRMKDLFENKNWNEVFFVPGNHENYNLLSKYPIIEKYNGKVIKISDNIYAMQRGEIYSIDGYKIFAFGGATSIDKELRELGKNYWLEEEFTEEEKLNAYKNLEFNNYKVDIVVSHTCSYSTMKHLIKIYNVSEAKLDTHTKFFEELKSKVQYKYWFFGHVHRDAIINSNEFALFDKIIRVPPKENNYNLDKIDDNKDNDFIYDYNLSDIIEIAKYGVSISTFNKKFKDRDL